ncbi:unnamed protein product, partial [marine sediment metagenome]
CLGKNLGAVRHKSQAFTAGFYLMPALWYMRV